jgi:hypothetical protein
VARGPFRYNSSIARNAPFSSLAEFAVLIWLLLMLIVVGVSLAVVLWGGTFFFQGYIYTEPSPGIYWQAPAAAALLTFGYTVWCLTIAFNSKATPQNLPIDSIFRFTAKEEMPDLKGNPAPRITAIKLDRKKTGADKDGETIFYVSKRDERGRFIYKDTTLKQRPWHGQDVIAIEFARPEGEKIRFDLRPTEQGGYREFVNSDGWVMREYEEGPTGRPEKFRFGRLLLNVFFNFAHLLGWFIALWLLLRFQWAHALGFAIVMWLAFTLIFLPMMLGYAGLVAANRHTAAALLGALSALA